MLSGLYECMSPCPAARGPAHSLDLFCNPGISAFERDPRGSAAGGSLDYALETPGLPLERQHGSSPTVLSFGDMWLVSLLQGRKWGRFWGIRAASALGPQPTCVWGGGGGACARRRGGALRPTDQVTHKASYSSFPLKKALISNFFSAWFKVLEPSKGKLEIN